MLLKTDDLVKLQFLTYSFYFHKINLVITASISFLELFVTAR